MKQGGIELLRQGHFEMTNPWGAPVVGWTPTSQGVGGLHNPRGFAMLRVVLMKNEKGGMVPLYDQPVIVENPGSIVIAQMGNRVGLVRNFRMIGERLLPDANAEYIKRLEAEGLWNELLESLGQWSWEAPRGLIPPKEEGGPQALTVSYIEHTRGGLPTRKPPQFFFELLCPWMKNIDKIARKMLEI